MITKTKLAIGALTTLFSGWGTYELLRTQSGTRSLGKGDNHGKENLEQNEQQVEKQAPTEPKSQTYREYLIANNEKIIIVDKSTTPEQIKNILLHRMFPNHTKTFSFFKDQMFLESPPISFSGQNVKGVQGKTLYILKRSNDTDARSLKEACIKALDKIKPENKYNVPDPQTNRLKDWCTIPTVKDVLLRHKFKLPQNDEWKEILNSNWIKDKSYSKKQSLFSNIEIKQFQRPKHEKSNIQIIRNKCEEVLEKPFIRNNFPAPLDFLGEGKYADEFQEAALFCTVPITAETYVKSAMQGKTQTSIPEELKNDYCHEEGKDVNYYKAIKTTDPMEGKSFWCAVRMIYYKK